ncbi:ATP-dependent RNA helicase HrpB [Thiosulfatimonas sediminis]|uniref:ATP-dependent RNA helicase HrpB n=1 Tax=Thiosulfatimonas sediminis TaxID=2675054 RepID=A0A6F8PUF3_9GAMM|nr:ATP-dependent helicase HrpB [Thiosulfatimonas sediminis]BBP45657.1 ATP-dependent RNA helicase HrpB [Thiosulfatimonas sediminis]
MVLQAEPGAGKSSVVPLALLQSQILQGQIILMLEPRRLAAKRLAEFLAQQLGEKVGARVGYRVRHENCLGPETRLQIITEGVLTRMIQQDPELQGVGLVIFDEFHERNLQADLGLALLLDIQQGLRDDLRCLIMSATLDATEIQNFLPASQLIFCAGRGFPVTVSYHPAPSQTPLWQFPQLKKVLSLALQESSGDILLFFAGQGEIHQAMQLCAPLCETAKVLALPLYGSLPPKEQDAVFQPSAQRKVIFSTNLAETSITLPGITAVIDSGLQKQLNYDPNVAMSRLQLQRISQASATQRMGRAGRVQAGHCYRLWSETQQQGLLAYDAPEMCRVDLVNLRMEIAQWGVNSADELAWLTPPPPAHLSTAETLLNELGFLTGQQRLSALGEQAMSLHPEPRFAKLLQLGAQYQALELACDLVALLQEGEILLNPQQVASADITLRLYTLWQALQDSSVLKRVHRARWHGFKRSRDKLYRRFDLSLKRNGESDVAKLGLLLALTYPDRIGKQRNLNGSYKLSNGRGAQLPLNDALQTQWLVAIEVDAQTQSGQQNAQIHVAAALNWLDVVDKLPLRKQDVVTFERSKQRVIGMRETWIGKLKIDSHPLKSLPQELVQQCLLGSLQQDWSQWVWPKSTKLLLTRAQWLAQFAGFESLAVLNETALQAKLDWLEPYTLNMTSLAELNQLNWQQIFQSLLGYADMQRLEKEAPLRYVAPTGREFLIEYSGRQAKVSLPLQQVFGELSSPILAQGQVSLTFELLSPAQRPIQTTADLANFWRTSYFEVAKEMRGRYPKHRWPDEPLLEKAGESIQRKKPV